MTYKITSASAKRLEEKLAVWSSEDFERYLQVMGQVYFDPTLEIAEESGSQGEAGWVPPYGVLFNVETCPAKWLPFLGQFVGTPISTKATEAEARAILKAECELNRGTLKNLESAIKRVLGVGVPFAVLERTAVNGTPAPYHFDILVGIGKSSMALKEAVEEKKPGGLMFAILEVEGAWIAGGKKWSEVVAGKSWATIKEGEF